MGEAPARELSDYDVPGEGVPVGHVEEDGEGMGEELVVLGVHEKELGAQDDVRVEAVSEKLGVEMLEVGGVWRGMEEGEVVGDEAMGLVGWGCGVKEE